MGSEHHQDDNLSIREEEVMPFRSKRQQRFMYAARPKGVDLDEWARQTDFSKLPERAPKKKRKRKKDKSDAPEPITDCFRIPEVEIELWLDEIERGKKEEDKDDVFQGPVSLESHGVDRILEFVNSFIRRVG
jgi:hypothetical protein